MATTRIARLAVSALMASLWHCSSTAADDGNQVDYPDILLKVIDRHLPVVFEDTTLTDGEKDVIVTDYQILLNRLVPTDWRPLFKPSQIQGTDATVTITSALRYSTKHLKRPDGYEEEFGLIGTSEDDVDYVVVRAKLSDGYKAAIALSNAHKESIRALPQFIALLNTIDKIEVPPVKDFFYLPGPNKKFSKELAAAPRQRIVEEYRRFRYAPTSILEFRMFEDKLATIVHATNKDDGHLYQRLVVYDDGHWKIVVVAPGA